MDIPTYIATSAVLIMLWHFTMNSSPRYFGIFQMIGLFTLGGAIGWYMDSMLFAFMMSFVMSLFFIH